MKKIKEIDSEVIAVISAAVKSIERRNSTRLVIKSMRKIQSQRNIWSSTGKIERMRNML